MDRKDDEDKGVVACVENQEEEQLKKPRRKDTPVLNCPPHIPGHDEHAHTDTQRKTQGLTMISLIH